MNGLFVRFCGYSNAPDWKESISGQFVSFRKHIKQSSLCVPLLGTYSTTRSHSITATRYIVLQLETPGTTVHDLSLHLLCLMISVFLLSNSVFQYASIWIFHKDSLQKEKAVQLLCMILKLEQNYRIKSACTCSLNL